MRSLFFMSRTLLCGMGILSILMAPMAQAFEGVSTKKVLENGLTVLVSEMPTSSMVSLYALIKAGSATEGRFLGSGVSHFLEHMLFKGTEKRGVGEIAAEVQALGGSINASTSFDYTIYTLTVPDHAFDQALDILSDMLQHSIFDPEEVIREQEVIFGEMRLHNDNPSRRLNQMVFSQVYHRHPYRHPIIGYESLFGALTRDEIFAYYQTYYAPNNMIFSVAGNIATDDVMPKVEAAFADFARRSDVPRHLPFEPPQMTRRHYEESYATPLARLSMAFGSVSLLHPDLYALDVLAVILGQGQSSRLYQEVYKKQGLVHSIHASSYTPMDKGAFEVEALLEYDQVPAAMEAVLAEIKQVKGRGVRKEELAKAKKRVLSDYIFAQQTSSGVAYSQAVDEAFSGDYHFSKNYVRHVKAVDNAAIMRVAQQYLKESNLTSVVLRPKEAVAHEEASVVDVQRQDVIKKVLPNGLTVLIRQDAAFPLVSVRLVLRGGAHEEDEATNGVASMMASAWTKGTKKYSAKALAEKIDALGMRLGGFSGKNSFGLSVQALAEDTPVALELLEELVKNPIFPEDELEKIREQMLAGIKQRQDNIGQMSHLALRKVLFKGHPLQWPEGGTEDSVKVLTRTQVVEYYRNFVVPSNMVLSVFGDVDAEQILEVVDKQWARLLAHSVELPDIQVTPLTGAHTETLTMDKEQAMVVLGFQGESITHPDREGLEVLTALLGSSFSGRLFRSVREEFGQAYTLGGSSVPAIDAGMIYFYVLTSEDSVEEVKRLMFKEIERIRLEPVSAQELVDIKNYLKGTFKASQETIHAFNFTCSLDELYGLGFKHYKDYDARMDAVSSEQVQRLAKQYLDITQSALVVTLPTQKDSGKQTE